MEEESSRFKPGGRRAGSIAALLAVAALGAGAGFIVAGCGSDNNNDTSNAVKSVQGGLSTAQGALSTAQGAVSTAKQKAQSVQSQVQSVQSQISTATSNSGGYGY
jgi:hypothetical protein